VDVSNPALPFELSHVDLTVYAYDLAVEGDHVFVNTSYQGSYVVDVSDPYLPVIAGKTTTQSSTAIAIEGGIVYEAAVIGREVRSYANALVPAAKLLGVHPLDPGADEETTEFMPGDEMVMEVNYLVTGPLELGTLFVGAEFELEEAGSAFDLLRRDRGFEAGSYSERFSLGVPYDALPGGLHRCGARLRVPILATETEIVELDVIE